MAIEQRRVPAQAKHFAVFLSRGLKRPVTPRFDEERGAWLLEAANTKECPKLEPVCGPDCDKDEHELAMSYVFTYGRNKYGMKVWSIAYFELTADGEEVDISTGIAEVLKAIGSAPSAPGAPGISGDSRQAGPDQKLSVKRSTVIRV